MDQIQTFTINPTVDISLEVDRLTPEGKNRAIVRSVVAGGGGINVVRCLRRLGAHGVAVHTAGGDIGHRLARLLDAEGLEHVVVPIEQETREAFVVAEKSTGRSFHIVPPGPTLSRADEARCLEAIGAAAERSTGGLIVLTGSMPGGLGEDFWARAVRLVKQGGARAVLDVAGPALRKMLPEGAFLIRLDRREASGLIGRSIEGFADARAANDAVLSAGPTTVAVTTVGALGAVCSTVAEHHEIHVPQLDTPIGSDACAGDSLVAAVTFQLASGADPLAACAYGVAAATATVHKPGTDVFERAEVEELAPGVRIVSTSR